MSTVRANRHRRRPTRWILVAALALLVSVLAGTELLLRAKPLVDTTPFLVTDLPPVALETEPSVCRRGADQDLVDTIGATIGAGGRITSPHVYACPAAFDGRRVTYVGEPVGELIRRRSGVWVQVNDDDYALEVGPMGAHRESRGFSSGLSVWLPDGLHEQIDGVGRPGRRGDIVLLEGVLLRADPDDGGGITLRADHLEVVAPTVEVPEPFHALQAIVAGVLAALAAATLLWSRATGRR
ncbi:hypothetical protein [Egicoccus halophilus]|uniref:Uncharacterized protein n=1 Tax=Egicoccus halophilus TaxID=1670830 RepID=A0A8J3AAD0_9ACTN|nr:hypothetical protein [Egicoccus halophilus]GGI08939.1 hypothetical protein GCM10011354_31590 [Egicoccus halophilus]